MGQKIAEPDDVSNVWLGYPEERPDSLENYSAAKAAAASARFWPFRLPPILPIRA
jgi:hypothetical protein